MYWGTSQQQSQLRTPSLDTNRFQCLILKATWVQLGHSKGFNARCSGWWNFKHKVNWCWWLDWNRLILFFKLRQFKYGPYILKTWTYCRVRSSWKMTVRQKARSPDQQSIELQRHLRLGLHWWSLGMECQRMETTSVSVKINYSMFPDYWVPIKRRPKTEDPKMKTPLFFCCTIL